MHTHRLPLLKPNRTIALAASLALLLLFPVGAFAAPKHAESAPSRRTITLEQAYDRTLAGDQSIRIAQYEIRKAALLPWSALARMGPSLTGNASYDTAGTSRSYASVRSGTDTVGLGSDTFTRHAGLTLEQPLLDFSVFPAYRRGKLAAESARLQHRFIVRQTLFGVAQAYYNVLKLQSVAAVNKETVDLAQKQLDVAQTRFNVGAVARIDVMRARATLEDARNTLIQSTGQLDTARDTLSNILNLEGATDFDVAAPPDAPDERPVFDTVLDRAWTGREDYRASVLAIDQDVERRSEIKAQYAPRVVAQASSGWTNTTSNASSYAHVNDAFVSVQMPFLTGGQREIDLRTASHQIAETRLNAEKLKKSIESEVKGAWIKIGTGRESIEALRAEVDAATQNYADLQAQYEAGTATSLDVQSALRDLNNARTLLTSQVYDYQVALRDLQRADARFERERVEHARAK